MAEPARSTCLSHPAFCSRCGYDLGPIRDCPQACSECGAPFERWFGIGGAGNGRSPSELWAFVRGMVLASPLALMAYWLLGPSSPFVNGLFLVGGTAYAFLVGGVLPAYVTYRSWQADPLGRLHCGGLAVQLFCVLVINVSVAGLTLAAASVIFIG